MILYLTPPSIGYLKKIEGRLHAASIHTKMLVGGDYYRATMLSEKIEVLHRFMEDETYKYLVIIDADRGEDILAYLSRIECPIRIVVDVDNLDEAITFKSSSLLTKSIFIRPFICRDTQGIIEECEPLVAFF